MSTNPRKRTKFAKGYLLKPDQGVPGFDSDVKASRASTMGALTVIATQAISGAPLHVHTREDEYFYVESGTLIIRCGEEVFRAGPGCFVFLPRNVPHSWDVFGGGIARILMMTVPAMLEEFLREFHAPSAVSREKIAAKYGITFLPEAPLKLSREAKDGASAR
jgi:mannose-6-phosphate isomerase-like protein (cupin superfamily)